jgi:hypothetical protein
MAAWRYLGALVLALVLCPAGTTQTCDLTETVQPGHCFRIRLEMSLSGEMHVQRDGMPVNLKLEASAAHEFPERVLSVNAVGLPDKSARIYQKAHATIAVGKDRSERTLRPDRCLLVAQRYKDQLLVYSPAGTLTREEADLTSEHFDTLFVTGLLPGRAVSVGDTWKVTNAVAQALCGFEGLTEQTLTCKLEGADGQAARVSVGGTATGIDAGALARLTIEAKYQYDLTAHHLVRLEWSQKDERDQGPASPATSVQASTVLTREAIEQPQSLTDVALISVPEGFEPPQIKTQLEYQDTQTGFSMLYGREWQIVSQDDKHVVMRLLDRGDFIAQLTLTPWTPAEKGKHMTGDEFCKEMDNTPGWTAQQQLQVGEVPSEGGNWIFRLSALGQLDETNVMQNFYLVAGPNGEQVVLAFTMAEKQANRLGNRDLSLAAGIEFQSSKKDAPKSK